MNEDVRAEDGGQVADADAVLPLPLEFEALYVATQEAFHDYALFYLGANDAAEEAVHRAFLEILNHWSAPARGEQPPAAGLGDPAPGRHIASP
ncbi:hypothetical protein GCM10017687_65530 [Streptomyces echinatus]|uniref:hypothetical protein n=1 Tax=Streptomyces echinatus TaxID=67293 RepID=UPI0031E61C8C